MLFTNSNQKGLYTVPSDPNPCVQFLRIYKTRQNKIKFSNFQKLFKYKFPNIFSTQNLKRVFFFKKKVLKHNCRIPSIAHIDNILKVTTSSQLRHFIYMLLNSQLALIEHLLGARPGAKSPLSLYHLIFPSQRPLDGG